MDKLQEIIEETGLAKTDADVLKEQFGAAAAVAEEWQEKAKTIVVTDESQTDLMLQARSARLEIREKRLAVTATHKELKAASLKRGQALDAVKRYVLGLLEPIEEHLITQEKFVELKREAEEAERRRKADELLRLQEEKERQEREAAEKSERERLAKELAAERAKAAEAKAKLAKEREEQEAIRRAEAAKMQREMDQKIAAERAAQEEKRKEQLKADEAAREKMLAEAAEQMKRKAAERKAKSAIHIVFDGDPTNLVYREMQNHDGEAVTVGEWVRREDGSITLVIEGVLNV